MRLDHMASVRVRKGRPSVQADQTLCLHVGLARGVRAASAPTGPAGHPVLWPCRAHQPFERTAWEGGRQSLTKSDGGHARGLALSPERLVPAASVREGKSPGQGDPQPEAGWSQPGGPVSGARGAGSGLVCRMAAGVLRGQVCRPVLQVSWLRLRRAQERTPSSDTGTGWDGLSP